MAKQSVVDMLKKPVTSQPRQEPQRGGLIAMLENELSEMAMERIRKKAMDSAYEELSGKISDSEGRASKAESELTVTRKALSEIQEKHKQMEAMHKAEKYAKEAANKACDEECEKTRKLELQVSQLTSRLLELERHNISLQNNLTGMTAEIGKRKQEPVKEPVSIPDFDVEVISRDLKGEIKTVILKPKR